MSEESEIPENQDSANDATPKKPASGFDVIADFVRRLPNSPGVYRMFNAEGDVLYVGKARNLKKRVSNYARHGNQTNRILRMIQLTSSMEFVTTSTETEALLLEANLIKRLRPRFNVLLRDDKSFPYILIGEDHAAPQIAKHRGARKRKGKYYGPFASAGAVNNTINALQKAFLLRTCTDSVYESRSRPCLLYQIKRCSAPCTGEISEDGYAFLVKEAHQFLSGKSQSVRKEISERMQQAADDLDFERAAIYRDRLSALSHIQSHQGINPQNTEEADVFACYQDGGQTCIQVFFFRTGQNWGNRAYFPKADKSQTEEEVLGAFVAQFYDNKPCPRLVLLSHIIEEQELVAEALTSKSDHKVAVSTPQRGEKRELVEHAQANAREAMGRRLAETSTQTRLLAGLAEVFDLGAPPKRIEVYDNSHIQGTNAVGGMIVAGPEGFMKNQYRKFNIKSQDITPGDDYGMMKEVLQRRFSRLLKENGPRPAQASGKPADHASDQTIDGSDNMGHSKDPAWPDLLLIDGGRGQLNVVCDILADLGIHDLPIVGVAKGPDRDAGRENFCMPGRDNFMLPMRDPVLYFIQRLRDEAHRFAIGTHRARRSKQISQTGLEDIPGIGPSRKRALLHHFGTAKAVRGAALSDLLAVEGISEQMASTIHAYFHDDNS
ncbi:excinuclease ABC subunit C [Cohaesibacter celericrescens]|uniref:UvrABC system protein C n=2 Tax=Cohaesibacter celericrescens TaxID=2067669 RepID=A0A2N5XXA4_9HYPH|nr:excinuclease ABC subunit UvrC [Cohaesibacter celericrescens]PLW79141.1 excinuclease ABC subunit C [Cohaesibacter celericrescens]